MALKVLEEGNEKTAASRAAWFCALTAAAIPIFAFFGRSEAVDRWRHVLVVGGVGLAILGVRRVIALRGVLRMPEKWWLILPLFLSLLISAFGSRAASGDSWFGGPWASYEAVVTVIAACLLIFIFSQFPIGRVAARRTIFAFVVAGLLLVSAVIWGRTIGETPTSVALFLIAVLSAGWMLWAKRAAWLRGPVYVLFSLFLFVTSGLLFWLLLGLDMRFPWIAALLGFGSVFVFLRGSVKMARLLPTVILTVLSMAFLLIPSPIQLSLPTVISPTYGLSATVAKGVLSEGFYRAAFGVGPAAYETAYARYKPASINQSSFWYARFDRARSDFLTRVTTTGLLGTVGWLVLVGWVSTLAIRRFREEDADALLPWVSVFFVLTLGAFFQASNLLLTWTWWVAVAAILGSGPMRERALGGARVSRGASFLSVLPGIFLMAWLVLAATMSMRAYAAFAAQSASTLYTQVENAEDVTQVIKRARRAVRWDPSHDGAYRTLAKASLTQARFIAGAHTGDTWTDEEREQLQSVVNVAVNAAAAATRLAPESSVSWALWGTVYRQTLSLVPNAGSLAVVALDRAQMLEPQNPSYLIQRGLLHLSVAERARTYAGSVEDPAVATEARRSEERELSLAAEDFQAAIDRKSDIPQAHYWFAAVLERQGRVEEAIARLRALRDAAPSDVGVGFQLALLYVRSDDMARAKAELQRLIALRPEYSNARWFLATVYEREGNLPAAIAELERVAELNPGISQVRERLEFLRAGGAATLLPPPVEETLEDGAAISVEEE